jgi:hypothetical protein
VSSLGLIAALILIGLIAAVVLISLLTDVYFGCAASDDDE